MEDHEKDSDKDGLTDFQETHKHMTNRQKADSDDDGIPDGNWLERREYQYTVKSVIQVLRPVTIDYLNDNYQDARVLDETESYVELEVVHYPFNTVSTTITANENWRNDAIQLSEWTKPGPSSDWTPEMRKELIAALKADGIDVKKLSDKELVERASEWLCDLAKYVDSFTTFATAWDESGKQ